MLKLEMLEIVRDVFQRLNKEQIPYCHWKSNYCLSHAVKGEGDLDILIEREKALGFNAILASFGFKKAAPLLFQNPPSVEHYYALDKETGFLVHVHLYYKIVTGESLVKNYCLPVEKMLLEETRLMDCVKVPSKEAELLIFLLRMMLKQMPLIENVLFLKDYKNIKEELLWLNDNFSREKFLSLIHQWFPMIGDEIFFRCMEIIPDKRRIVARVMYGIKIRRKLCPYMRRGYFLSSITTYALAAQVLWNRIFLKRRLMAFSTGGVVVAVIGTPASGKSTVVEALGKWLKNDFTVHTLHAGKPPSTWLTWLPNRFLPFARKLFPKQRSTFYEMHPQPGCMDRSLLHILRMIFLSYDRRSLLMKYYRKSRNGAIVLFDRYPSRSAGAVDSSAFTETQIRKTRGLKSFLMALERKMYENMPLPDIVIHLSAPLEVALRRDVLRDKEDANDPDYIRQRHNLTIEPSFPCTLYKEISTDDTFQKTERDIKKFLWAHL